MVRGRGSLRHRYLHDNNDELTEDSERHVSLLGVPINKGQRKLGPETAPAEFRKHGLAKRLRDLDREVVDYGDVTFSTAKEEPDFGVVRYPRTVAMSTIEIEDRVEECLREQGHCLALGGDHSMAIGTIIGHARVQPNIVVLWIDAHADFNTPLTSPSGNIHGMALSLVTKELEPYIPQMPGWEKIRPCIAARDIAWIGLRDVDPGERRFIDKYGMAAYSMHDVDCYGVKHVLDKALNDVDPTGTRPIHVSFDVDGMDPGYAPSTGTPVTGGLTLRECNTIAEELAKTGRLTMVDVAEVNPKVGDAKDVDLTMKNTMDVLSHFYGNQRRGFVPKGYEIPIPYIWKQTGVGEP